MQSQANRRFATYRHSSPPSPDAALPLSLADAEPRGPSSMFWFILHAFCCFVSLALGFRFSRVLSDPQKRAVYDYQYGEKGLKGRISSGHPMSSDDAFAEYFGFSSPFGGMSGGGGGSTRTGSRVNEDIFGSTFGAAGKGASTSSQVPQKAATIEKPLPCSLEELYKGTVKKMKISREILGVLG
ncbi:hypothetical protein ZIOFF_013975 [Zingiber officinale]|uniref:Uncharacterized protein n=1 Tax=Zingiber officinale TaxID=94328 RepID=A0A8J5LP67_ZINOF|nr:hypothetical protein ZIOFF_013975 [Zingiber officinale]